jgi:prevent-host-death family protein
MGAVAARELRNHTAEVIRRVQAGEEVTLTSRGEPVAKIIPIDAARREYMTREEFLAMPLFDAGFAKELAEMDLDNDDNWEGVL